MFMKSFFFKKTPKTTVNTGPYDKYKLLTSVTVPEKDVVWHRIHGECPESVAKDGFKGRKDLPTNNLKSYVALNTPFGGFGGTVSADDAYEFYKKGANNIKNYCYSSINPNPKLSIPAFIRENADDVAESSTTSKISEMEVMALGDIGAEYIVYATGEDDLEKFFSGIEVENLMSRYNPKLPPRYKKSDVESPVSVMLHLIKTGCVEFLTESVKKGVYSVAEMVELAKQPLYSELSDYLKGAYAELGIEPETIQLKK